MALTKISGSILKDPLNLGEVSIGGTLTYEDVTNVDALGIGTFRTGIKVLAGGINAVGVITATSFSGGLPITSGADNRVITASSASAIQGEANLTYNGSILHNQISAGARNDFSTSADGLIIEKGGNTGLSIDPGSSGTAAIYFPNESNHSIASITHNNSTGEFKIRGEDHIILSTNNNTERLRIDFNGMIGIGGVTPKTQNTFDAIEFGKTGFLGSQTGARTVEIASNAYYNSGWKYKENDVASLYYQYQGYHAFASAASGSADGAISFSEKLRIDSSGRLLLGTTTEGHENADNLTISDSSGSAGMTIRSTSNNCHIYFSDATSGAGEYVGQLGYNHGSDYMFFHTGGSERFRIDSSGVSGDVKNNFLLNEFKRTDTSSQHGALGSNFTTDNTINLTISNYQRGQRIIVRACVPCGIALNNSSGTNYAGTSVRVKVTGNTSGGATYSNDRPVWYRADGAGTHETVQNVFICVYINESDTTFSNGETLTINLEGRKNGGGAGTSTHYLGGWSSVKEITSERYIKEL